MPIYEYECPKCGRFDALQKMSEPALKTHDVCGSKVTKLMSASAFAFKGSGFYITDYNGRNSAAITGREPKPDPKPEPKSDAKDAKKDAKAKPAACASCPANKSAA
jgi:putative FmdB family regulatory protein